MYLFHLRRLFGLLCSFFIIAHVPSLLVLNVRFALLPSLSLRFTEEMLYSACHHGHVRRTLFCVTQSSSERVSSGGFPTFFLSLTGVA